MNNILFSFAIAFVLVIAATVPVNAVNESPHPYQSPKPHGNWYILETSSVTFDEQTQLYQGKVFDHTKKSLDARIEVTWSPDGCLITNDILVKVVDGKYLAVKKLPEGWDCNFFILNPRLKR